MTDIQWGAEIPVDGKRPTWLRDDETVNRKARVPYDRDETWWSNRAEAIHWCFATSIQLPADHWVYAVFRWNAEHPDQVPFEPWGGDDAAPGDWDGADVLRVDHTVAGSNPFKTGNNSTCDRGWSREQRGLCIIIAYRRKDEPTTGHLTITLTGPQGCGKTQTKEWLERNLPQSCNGVHYRDMLGNLVVKIVDGADDTVTLNLAADPKLAPPPVDADKALADRIRDAVKGLNALRENAKAAGLKVQLTRDPRGGITAAITRSL